MVAQGTEHLASPTTFGTTTHAHPPLPLELNKPVRGDESGKINVLLSISKQDGHLSKHNCNFLFGIIKILYEKQLKFQIGKS